MVLNFNIKNWAEISVWPISNCIEIIILVSPYSFYSFFFSLTNSLLHNSPYFLADFQIGQL